MKRSFYQMMILSELKGLKEKTIDSRHVEGWMRCEHRTLDGLGLAQFKREVAVAVECIREMGASKSETLAKSFGL